MAVAIMLNSLPLCDGLVWSDEFTWTSVAQNSEYSLTGALIVQVATQLAGRPITLTGQSDGLDHTAWMSRTNVLALKAALEVPDATFILTLHDARTFAVRAAPNPLDAEPLPVYRNFLPANPSSDRWYRIHALKLQTV
jgi:hypothetical protein